jgi:hypothetical protein
MGKGFNASEGVLEEDLGCLLMLACQKKVGGKRMLIGRRALISHGRS